MITPGAFVFVHVHEHVYVQVHGKETHAMSIIAASVEGGNLLLDKNRSCKLQAGSVKIMDPRNIDNPDTGTCRLCGTCCAKGGPALHLEDKPLVESGSIALRHLFTIRAGEPAFDNVRGGVIRVETDIIKIRPAAGRTAACTFLEEGRYCAIYDHRPQECRVLKCWDTRGIMRAYDRERLTRDHLLSAVEGLRDLVQAHQERCDYGILARHAEQLKGSGEAADRAGEAIAEMIRYDCSVRQLAVERGRLDKELLLFLFGRPVTDSLKHFHVKIAAKGGGLHEVGYIM